MVAANTVFFDFSTRSSASLLGGFAVLFLFTLLALLVSRCLRYDTVLYYILEAAGRPFHHEVSTRGARSKRRSGRNNTHSVRKTGMNKFWKIAPWLSRLILLPPTVIFSLIATRYLTHPVASAAAQGITFSSNLGLTIDRKSVV